MTQETITLTIEKLAGLGDGAGMHQSRKVFVPYTLPGDVVRATLTRKTADADYAARTEILNPSPDRIAPVCKHFGACGGCSLQHVNSDTYRDFKLGMARAAVRKAGYDPDVVAPLIAIPPASRRRCELKVAGGKLGFYGEATHTLIDIEECHVLEPNLIALILRLKPHLLALPGLESMQINGVDEGYDILLEGTQDAPWQLPPDPAIRRITARNGKTYATLIQTGPVTVTLANVAVEVPPGAFLQASLQAQEKLTALVCEQAKKASSILDLFAGIGTYSFALAHLASVTAVEGNAAMADALRKAASAHHLKLTANVRDLFHRPLAGKELAPFDFAVINPPRAGAHAQCTGLARAKIPAIAMVSCNPATFARDARLLKEAGYQLARVTPIDQFAYSAHLELAAEFFI